MLGNATKGWVLDMVGDQAEYEQRLKAVETKASKNTEDIASNKEDIETNAANIETNTEAISTINSELSSNIMQTLGITVTDNSSYFTTTINKSLYNDNMFLIDFTLTTTDSTIVNFYTVGSTHKAVHDTGWTPYIAQGTSTSVLANAKLTNNTIQFVPTTSISSGTSMEFTIIGIRS